MGPVALVIEQVMQLLTALLRHCVSNLVLILAQIESRTLACLACLLYLLEVVDGLHGVQIAQVLIVSHVFNLLLVHFRRFDRLQSCGSVLRMSFSKQAQPAHRSTHAGADSKRCLLGCLLDSIGVVLYLVPGDLVANSPWPCVKRGPPVLAALVERDHESLDSAWQRAKLLDLVQAVILVSFLLERLAVVLKDVLTAELNNLLEVAELLEDGLADELLDAVLVGIEVLSRDDLELLELLLVEVVTNLLLVVRWVLGLLLDLGLQRVGVFLQHAVVVHLHL